MIETDIININVELSKIPREKMREVNGKKYINLTIDQRRTPDKYGNDLCLYVRRNSKEDEKIYVGSGKTITFNKSGKHTAPTAPTATPPQSNNDDLPF